MTKKEKIFLLAFIYSLVAFSASGEIWTDIFWGIGLLLSGSIFVFS